jgi:hypothetical protein
MRKTVFIFISLLFTGGLLVYTGLANLDLLTRVYPNSRFVIFGMLALEGGVIYWIVTYLLHWTGQHKGIAVCMIGIDALFSGMGFFYDISLQSGSHAFMGQLPPVVVLISLDVVFNVAVGIVAHLLPDGREVSREDFRPLVEAARSAGQNIKNALPQRAATKNGDSHNET